MDPCPGPSTRGSRGGERASTPVRSWRASGIRSVIQEGACALEIGVFAFETWFLFLEDMCALESFVVVYTGRMKREVAAFEMGVFALEARCCFG